ncbi:uncharacterized protein UMAG_02045 [Mycosarcoma maydis]|uniref:Uncharacterized protein n=1 Tax=Mycosarcoma maydis TaxID=5270 RepID=A0A0D1E548_MYCMD|nr:uncharacterized protein UMAG_02045 [Ustilago maydis 521]KIS69505.1 hypothetical protein UMAG_02045 [Ustilago maydis 521]|eukprot:XP_011388430.1 hypothetical protein UMAG_02045 [Ustilago maydis 521]
MLSSRFITRAIRPSTRTLRSTTLAAIPQPALRSRTYASSPTPNSFPQLPPGFEKLAHSPSALTAISNLVEVMKQNGVDLHTGEKPSMWQMVKLARNQEVRDATTKVMEELKNAGIDVSPERLQAIMNSQNDFFGGDKQNGGKKE